MTGKGVHVEGIECEDWMAVNLGKVHIEEFCITYHFSYQKPAIHFVSQCVCSNAIYTVSTGQIK